MKWKKGTMLYLEPRDLKVMSQCNMPIRELIQCQRTNENIPPLWSVLSYVMYQCHSDHANIWYRYRTLLEVAKDTNRYYFHGFISKASGGKRELYIPQGIVQCQQEFILTHILRYLPVDDHAFAYRKGIHMEDCAKPHVGKQLLLHLDLQDFFGSVKENMVYQALLEETGYSKSLCRCLAQLCCLRGRLPQGTVTSPMLSNIVFRHCDEALAALAAEKGMVYSRYSDDLYFSTDSQIDVRQVLRQIKQTLQSYGFRINPEKTKVLGRQHRQAVLGLTVNQHLQVNRQYRRDLLQELHYWEKFGEGSKGAQQAGDYLQYMQQLQGKVAYVLHMDPENSKFQEANRKLIRKIQQTIFEEEKNFIWVVHPGKGEDPMERPGCEEHEKRYSQGKLEELLEILPGREEEVLRFRCGMEDGAVHTREETAAFFGIEPERVRQMEVKILNRLRKMERKRNLKEFLQ